MSTRNTMTVLPCLGAAALLMAAGSALGQNCDNGVIPTQCTPLGNCLGPDVIVGDLNGISNYASVGGVEAISVGTTSCNIGNTWLNWIDSTNQHPVIGQNAYRLRTVDGSTRFEQVGMSWLKHGFFALSQQLCCTACQSTDGSHLGIHCSDPYTASRNGSQGGLGPRWQVNAAQGAFQYPPANPAFSGSVARRCQISISDIDTTAGVLYFVSGHYVTPDDALAGNKYNNESWRGCTVSGSGTAWNFALAGQTQRAQQAIRAWGANDTGVVYSDVFIPNDGLVVVAAKATALANGIYHYEYAIQNMNSDRSVQGVTVPIPEGVTVTNIGFHDVPYHDGDGPQSVNFAGTDWAGFSAGGALKWRSQSFSENFSANALRWGTLYNFRFDANVAPAPGGGVVQLTLFRPGLEDSVNTSNLPVPGNPAPPACPCDYNADATLNSADFFAFLADMLSSQPGADYNHDGTVTSQDLFDFLACFLSQPTGC